MRINIWIQGDWIFGYLDITLRYTFTEVVRDGGEGGREWNG